MKNFYHIYLHYHFWQQTLLYLWVVLVILMIYFIAFFKSRFLIITILGITCSSFLQNIILKNYKKELNNANVKNITMFEYNLENLQKIYSNSELINKELNKFYSSNDKVKKISSNIKLVK